MSSRLPRLRSPSGCCPCPTATSCCCGFSSAASVSTFWQRCSESETPRRGTDGTRDPLQPDHSDRTQTLTWAEAARILTQRALGTRQQANRRQKTCVKRRRRRCALPRLGCPRGDEAPCVRATPEPTDRRISGIAGDETSRTIGRRSSAHSERQRQSPRLQCCRAACRQRSRTRVRRGHLPGWKPLMHQGKKASR